MTKRLQEEYEERGFGQIDGAVCADHVQDAYLSQRVRELASEMCTYCRANQGVPMEILAGMVMDTIRAYFVPAIEHLMWDDMERQPDSRDVLYEIVEGDLDEAVFEDLAKAIHDVSWVALSASAATGHSWFTAGWKRFRRWVIERSRFLLEPKPPADYELGEAPQDILDALGHVILQESRIVPLPVGTPVFRARTRLPTSPAATEFTAPRPAIATPGRMNTTGIPVFYGALDATTAAVEAYDGSSRCVVAEFHTVTELAVVDLTDFAIPSIYNLDDLDRRNRLLFLSDFAADVAQPYDKGSEAELQYLPTQAFTEYLRLRLPAEVKTPVHGLMFRSSRLPRRATQSGDSRTGINLVLFCGPEGALTDDQIREDLDSRGLEARRRSEDQLVRLNESGIWEYEYGPPSAHRGRAVDLR